MGGVLVIGIALLIAVLLGVVLVWASKGIRSGKIRPRAAKFFAFIGVIVVLGVFIALMGLLKNLQG